MEASIETQLYEAGHHELACTLATSQAFLLDGARDGADVNVLSDAWAQGYLEWVDFLQRIAFVVVECLHAADQVYAQREYPDFPGMFHYEVTTEVGTVLAAHIVLTNGEEDNDTLFAHAMDALYTRLAKFFGRALETYANDPESLAEEKETLAAVMVAIEKIITGHDGQWTKHVKMED